MMEICIKEFLRLLDSKVNSRKMKCGKFLFK
jgi:hypothetical protein